MNAETMPIHDRNRRINRLLSYPISDFSTKPFYKKEEKIGCDLRFIGCSLTLLFCVGSHDATGFTCGISTLPFFIYDWNGAASFCCLYHCIYRSRRIYMHPINEAPVILKKKGFTIQHDVDTEGCLRLSRDFASLWPSRTCRYNSYWKLFFEMLTKIIWACVWNRTSGGFR